MNWLGFKKTCNMFRIGYVLFPIHVRLRGLFSHAGYSITFLHFPQNAIFLSMQGFNQFFYWSMSAGD